MGRSPSKLMGLMPRYRIDVSTELCRAVLFDQLLESIADKGYQVLDYNRELSRIIVRRPPSAERGSCLYSVWIRKPGRRTIVTFGAFPGWLASAFGGVQAMADRLGAVADDLLSGVRVTEQLIAAE